MKKIKNFMLFLKHWFFRVTAVAVGTAFGLGLTTAYGFIEPAVRYVRVPVEVMVDKKPDVQQLLREIPERYGVPGIVVAVLLEKESNGKMNAIRFEEHYMRRKDVQSASANPEQRRMLSSSHCALQVMGINAVARGYSWSDLYDPEICVEVSMAIFADCMERHVKAGSKYDQLKRAFECYNGSEHYAHDAMNKLSRLAVEKL